MTKDYKTLSNNPEETLMMKRESANLIQFYQDQFEQEIRQYEECNRKGDYIGAFYHYDFAHSINEYLKALESVHTK